MFFPAGIRVWHNCPDATIDICFIHGLAGNRESTWTAQGDALPWPQTLLPPRLGKARILSFGYDAYVGWRSFAPGNGPLGYVVDLLNDLCQNRIDAGALSRPLVFVAHGLGGLLCKKAILVSRSNVDQQLQDVFDSTCGIIFMGTPHRGAWMADWAKIPASALGVVRSTDKSLFQILSRDEMFFASIQDDSRSILQHLRKSRQTFRISCFCEMLPMPGGGLVVSKESGTMNSDLRYRIQANHNDMVKFKSAEDAGFERVLRELKLLEGAVQTTDAQPEVSGTN